MNVAPVGVSVMPLENRRDVLIGVATTAERLGYDGFFLPETWAHDDRAHAAGLRADAKIAGEPVRRTAWSWAGRR